MTYSQSWCNIDYFDGANHLVPGKRSQAEIDGEDNKHIELGIFCELQSELMDSLIAVTKTNKFQARWTFNKSLKTQAAEGELRQKN